MHQRPRAEQHRHDTPPIAAAASCHDYLFPLQGVHIVPPSNTLPRQPAPAPAAPDRPPAKGPPCLPSQPRARPPKPSLPPSLPPTASSDEPNRSFPAGPSNPIRDFGSAATSAATTLS